MKRLVLAALLGCSSPPPVVRAVTSVPPPTDAAIAPADSAVVLAVWNHLAGVDIIETRNEAIHTHGGPPAAISEAYVNFAVRDRVSHSVSATKLELLRGHCRSTTWDQRTPLAITGYGLYTWNDANEVAHDASKIALPAVDARYQVRISFAPVSAYQACDRFGFAVALVVDGANVALELPLDVIREEPLRDP